MGKRPESVVIRKVSSVFRIRQGRGFSEAELKEAGISVASARKLSIKVDPRRRTKLNDNVRTLKTSLEAPLKHRPRRNKRRKAQWPIS
ncbi:ribosomal protein L13e [Candidatus Bathyarchaeota archaeon]|nr:ribosomal protein L13e [Candidatus Bathyarchaeota archaeon]